MTYLAADDVDNYPWKPTRVLRWSLSGRLQQQWIRDYADQDQDRWVRQVEWRDVPEEQQAETAPQEGGASDQSKHGQQELR